METLFIGKNLLFLTEVESTNTYAMGMLRNVNALEGTVVHTDHQTKGKGQRGSTWNSAIASNITASIILKPTFLKSGETFFLSKISALALYDVLTDVLNNGQYDIKIKWPNDMLVDSKKIAGILIENNFNQNLLLHSVIGIGLNVNQAEFHDLSGIATSLKLLTGQQHDRAEVLEKLCRYLEKWYLMLKSGNVAQIRESYLSKLKGMNSTMSFRTPDNNEFRAKIVDVNREGQLCLEMPDSVIRRFDIKELRFAD
jgi:BirA family biotin operon repressor/biotin-[acetyl-CoA-carboxylase] ligase